MPHCVTEPVLLSMLLGPLRLRGADSLDMSPYLLACRRTCERSPPSLPRLPCAYTHID